MIYYPPGTPCWVDLCSPDVDASVAFYHDLFGWEAGSAEQSSGYRMFSSEGKLVSGIVPLKSEQGLPQWTTYISTDNIARDVRRAEIAGGKVLMETTVNEDVKMVILQDAVGATFGIFQLGTYSGAQMFNQPVSLTFNQLTTRSRVEGKRFYSQVFGWEPHDRDMGGGFAFTYFLNGVRAIAGLMTMDEQKPKDLSSHWLVYFAVDDADTIVARATELGGSVAQPPADTPLKGERPTGGEVYECIWMLCQIHCATWAA